MARKAKPTYLKVLQGNPGKRALPKGEIKPLTTLPEPPEHLNEDGMREWQRIVGELNALNVLTGMDWQSLSIYCTAFQLWVDAIRNVKDKGSMVLSSKGFPLQNPYLAVVNKQAEIMLKMSSEFGFTPSARARMGMAADRAESDVAKQFFG